jgi:hypothetical protein
VIPYSVLAHSVHFDNFILRWHFRGYSSGLRPGDVAPTSARDAAIL